VGSLARLEPMQAQCTTQAQKGSTLDSVTALTAQSHAKLGCWVLELDNGLGHLWGDLRIPKILVHPGQASTGKTC
jgi:hypothetical protein